MGDEDGQDMTNGRDDVAERDEISKNDESNGIRDSSCANMNQSEEQDSEEDDEYEVIQVIHFAVILIDEL